MLSFEEARQRILERAVSFGEETIPLESSLHRVLAATIFADRDYPPFNRSAMDGFAIRFSDWARGIRRFEWVETIFPGKEPARSIGEGQCYRIMTGAAVPDPADTVIRVEDSQVDKKEVIFSLEEISQWQNISKRGEDRKEGALALAAPVRIMPPVIGLLAALGNTTVRVMRKPSVALLTTGDEVVLPGTPVNPYQIRNSNWFQLQALMQAMGLQPYWVRHAQDEKMELNKMLQEAWEADILITCGAVSAGDADFIPGVMKDLGAEELFHKVAIRPGKPLWVGTRKGKLSFCLPGNPLSCLTDFLLFVKPFLDAAWGLRPIGHTMPVNFSRTRRTQLDEFFPVKIDWTTNTLQQLSFNGSGDITAALNADAIGRHPVYKPALQPGDLIEIFMV